MYSKYLGWFVWSARKPLALLLSKVYCILLAAVKIELFERLHTYLQIITLIHIAAWQELFLWNSYRYKN